MDCLERIRTLLEERAGASTAWPKRPVCPNPPWPTCFCATTCPRCPPWSASARPWASPWRSSSPSSPPCPPKRSSPPSCWRSGPPFPRPKSAWCWSWSTSWGGPEKIFQNQGLTPPGKPGIINTRYGGIAQLVRAPASHVGGHRFESCCPHHKSLNAAALRLFSFSPT